MLSSKTISSEDKNYLPIIKSILESQSQRSNAYSKLFTCLQKTINEITKKYQTDPTLIKDNIDEETFELHTMCKELISTFGQITSSMREYQSKLNKLSTNFPFLINIALQIDQLQNLEQSRFKIIIPYIQRQLQTFQPECSHDHDKKNHHNHNHHHHHQHNEVTKISSSNELFPNSKSISQSTMIAILQQQQLQQYGEQQQYQQHLPSFDSNQEKNRGKMIENYIYETKPLSVTEHEAMTDIHSAVQFLEDPNNNNTLAKNRVIEAFLQQQQQEHQQYQYSMEKHREINKQQFLTELTPINEEISDILEELQSEYSDQLLG